MKERLNDFAAEFTKWLQQVCSEESPPDSIVAFNIGLFETSKGYSVYLIGATEYSDRDDDWACHEAFTPKARYFSIPIMPEIKDWKHVQQLIAEATKSFLNSVSAQNCFLSAAKAVTVGFDDGDLERIR